MSGAGGEPLVHHRLRRGVIVAPARVVNKGVGAPQGRPGSAEAQRPVKTGGRFSMKAAMPSFWSSVEKSAWNRRRS